MIDIYSVKQNLSDLESRKDEVDPGTKDAIERVTDDVKEILETIQNFNLSFR